MKETNLNVDGMRLQVIIKILLLRVRCFPYGHWENWNLPLKYVLFPVLFHMCDILEKQSERNRKLIHHSQRQGKGKADYKSMGEWSGTNRLF